MKIIKQRLFCAVVVLICLFLSSCASTGSSQRYFGYDTTKSSVEMKGKIRRRTLKQVEDSILLNTERQWSPDLSAVLGTESLERSFSAETIFHDETYNLVIHYLLDTVTELEERDTFQIAGRRGLFDLKNTTLFAFRVEGLPSQYEFEQFDLPGIRAHESTSVSSSELPKAFAHFSIYDKRFTVLVTSMYMPNHRRIFGSNFSALVADDNQLFQIVDEDNNVWASFTKDAYTLYSVDKTFDAKQLWSCISVFLTVQEIAAGR